MSEDGARRAYSVQSYFCEHCDNLHLALQDEFGRIYTEAILSNDMVLKMVRMMMERDSARLGEDDR